MIQKRVWWCWLAAMILVNFVVLLEGSKQTVYWYTDGYDPWFSEKVTEITGEQLAEFVKDETSRYSAGESEKQFQLVTYKKAKSGTSLEELKQRMDVWYGRTEIGSNHVLFLVSTCEEEATVAVKEGDAGYRRAEVMGIVYKALRQMGRDGKIDQTKWVIWGEFKMEKGIRARFGLSITSRSDLTLDPSTLEKGTIVNTGYDKVYEHYGLPVGWVSIENKDVILRLMEAARKMVEPALENSDLHVPDAHWRFCQPSTEIIATTKELCTNIIYWDTPYLKVRGPMLDLVRIKSMALIHELENFLTKKLEEFKPTYSIPNLQIFSHLTSTHQLPDVNKRYKLTVILEVELSVYPRW